MPYHFSVGTFTCSLDVASWLSHGFDSHHRHFFTVFFLLPWSDSLLSHHFLAELLTPMVFAVAQSAFLLGFARVSQSVHLSWCFWVATAVDLASPVHSVPFFWVGS